MKELEALTDQRMDFDNKCQLWKAGLFLFQDDDTTLKYALAFFLPLYMTDALNITSLIIELTNLINSLIIETECEEMTTGIPIVDSEASLIEKENLFGEKQSDKLEEIKRMPFLCI